MQTNRQLKHYTKKASTNIYSAPKHARQKKIQEEKQGGKETKERTISQSKKTINKAIYKSSFWEWLVLEPG